MNRTIQWLIATILIGCLFGCGSNDKPQVKLGEKTYEVKKVSVEKKLHFTGNIQPLHENLLSSPVEAIVEKVHYHYGQWVKKGEVILTLNSQALQKQYNDALTSYLKAKDNYSMARTKFSGTQELWAAGLLSKNNYLSERSSLDNARVNLMQTTRTLSEMLKKMDSDTVPNLGDLSELSFSEFEKVRKALMARHNIIHIKAATNGILLYPPKSSDNKKLRLTVGKMIKADEAIGLIGDLRGVRVEINISEIDIDKVYTGMNAQVRGIAFGNEKLKGKLVSINSQASSNSSSGLPSFTAIVEVDRLTPKQQAYLKIGMSASIELTAHSRNELLIPISAVKENHGQTVVKVKNKKGIIRQQIVRTGAAEADKVVINSGLHEGDMVIYG